MVSDRVRVRVRASNRVRVRVSVTELGIGPLHFSITVLYGITVLLYVYRDALLTSYQLRYVTSRPSI